MQSPADMKMLEEACQLLDLDNIFSNKRPIPSSFFRIDPSEQVKCQRKMSIEWSEGEDKLLRILVKSANNICWRKIAKKLNKHAGSTRSSSQCSQRWCRVIDDKYQKGRWTKEEDELLIEALKTSPPRKWKTISEKIPGRSDIQVRDHLQSVGAKWVKMQVISNKYVPE